MSDPAILEAAAQALFASEMPGSDWSVFPGLHDKFRARARAVTPLIRNAALEKAAQAATGYFLFRTEDTEDVYQVCEAIAARIRAFKE